MSEGKTVEERAAVRVALAARRMRARRRAGSMKANKEITARSPMPFPSGFPPARE